MPSFMSIVFLLLPVCSVLSIIYLLTNSYFLGPGSQPLEPFEGYVTQEEPQE